MSSNRFYLVHFSQQGPVWEYFDGLAASECDPPGRSAKQPVVALVPDRLLFFFLPTGVAAKGERSQKAAIRLQMSHVLPAIGEGGDTATFKAPSGQVTGVLFHEEFGQFVEQNKDVLQRATFVSSAFLLSWAAAAARGINVWTWSDGNGLRALHAGGDLHYFAGDDAELADRVDAADLGDAPPIQNWSETLAGIVQNKVNLRSLNLPVRSLGHAHGGAGPGRKLIAATCLIGLLFCFGEAGRWLATSGEADQWQSALREEYAMVLPDPDVPDPYGKLLYRMDQMENGNVQGVDVLSLLEVLSGSAPQGFIIQSLSLGPNGGTIKATAADYDSVQAMVESVSGAGGFSFTLDNAKTGEGQVDVVLGVTW